MTKRLQEWERDALSTAGDRLVRDLVDDFRRGPSQASSMASRPGAPQEPPRKASGGTVELKPPPGIEHVDAIAASFEQRERLEALIKQRALVRDLVDRPVSIPEAAKK